MAANKLSPKQKRFVAEYLIDLNATAAAERSGYRHALVQGPRLLGNVRVGEAIQKAQQRREIRTEITQDRVLKEIARLAFIDPRKLFDSNGHLKPVAEMDDDTAACIASIEVEQRGVKGADGEVSIEVVKKVKLWDKRGSLELLGKHLRLFGDRLKVTDADGNIVKFIIEE